MPAILDPDKGTIYQGPKKETNTGAKSGGRSTRSSGGRLANNLSGYPLVAARAARAAGVPVPLFLAQINQESSFDPTAVSPAGALGIAQFMPATAQGVGVNPLDPRAALRAAAKMDAANFKKHKNWYDVLSLYNSGKGWAQGQNISETSNYVSNIMSAASQPWGGIDVGRKANFGRLFPIFGKTKPTWGGGPQSHGSRPLGNWQSDNAYDVMAPAGTPVYAVARGRIDPSAGFGAQSSSNPKVYGSRLHLDVPGPNELFYTHLSRIAPGIRPGRKVSPGTLLGWVADYGSADHTHFASEFGDPKAWLTGNRAPFNVGPSFSPQADYGSGMVNTAYGPTPASIASGVTEKIAPVTEGVDAAASAAFAPAMSGLDALMGAGGPIASAVKKKRKKGKGDLGAVEALIANLAALNGPGILPATRSA